MSGLLAEIKNIRDDLEEALKHVYYLEKLFVNKIKNDPEAIADRIVGLYCQKVSPSIRCIEHLKESIIKTLKE